MKASDDVPSDLLEQFEIPTLPIIYCGSEDRVEVAKHFVEPLMAVARKYDKMRMMRT